MTTPKIIPIVRYFILTSFLVSTVFIILIYFSPTPTTVDYSILYGGVFCLLTAIFLTILIIKSVVQKSNRRKFLSAIFLLVLNASVAIAYYFVWDYSLGTILIKIINHTGHNVTEAGIYGCHGRDWGILPLGESKTVRFPGNTGCAFIVKYNLNGDIRFEMLPRKEFTMNIYFLGTNQSIEVDR